MWKPHLHRRNVLFVKRSLCQVSSLLVFLAAIASGQQAVRSAQESHPVPVFAVLGSEGSDHAVSIDPMLFIDGVTIRSVPSPCTETPALHDFENRYLKPGTVYPVVFGGVQRGTLSVTKLEGSDWRVRLDSDVRIHGLTMALAVGSASLAGNGGLRRSPTIAEQDHVRQLAKEILTSNGAPAASLSRVRLDQVTATQLNHSLKLIASVEVERADKLNMDYSLFFIADPVSSEKSIIWFQHSNGETDAQALYLIDQLNAGQNGIDRLFVRRVFYENYSYEVYENRDGHWVKDFASEVFGCL
jgi:hypothetical protein